MHHLLRDRKKAYLYEVDDSFLHYCMVLHLKSISSEHNFGALKKSIQENYNEKTHVTDNSKMHCTPSLLQGYLHLSEKSGVMSINYDA